MPTNFVIGLHTIEIYEKIAFENYFINLKKIVNCNRISKIFKVFDSIKIEIMQCLGVK